MVDQDLIPYKIMFAFNFFELVAGFCYLGFFLKLVNYREIDWRWLLQKFENHFGN